jgi:hypothetical protein
VTEPASVEWVGGPQAAADMRRWADQLGPEVAKRAGPFAERVADIVRGRVPHLTGQLASSVDAIDADEDQAHGVGVSLGDGVAYAGWIEFGGTRGRPYVPNGRYLYPTAQEAAEEWATLAGDAANDTVSRFSWSTPAV